MSGYTISLELVEERGGFRKVGELETGQGAHLSLDILREKLLTRFKFSLELTHLFNKLLKEEVE